MPAVRDSGQRGDVDADGYVLVGGRSSRFGSDKAVHKIGGRPMALRAADALRPHVGTVTLVGGTFNHLELGLPSIPDSVDSAGPLGGIVAALQHARSSLCVVLACDMPHVASAPIETLIRTAVRTGAGAIVPETPDGRLQPLCAVYAKRTASPLARALSEGTRRIAAALQRIDWIRLPVNDARPFANVNRVSDLYLIG